MASLINPGANCSGTMALPPPRAFVPHTPAAAGAITLWDADRSLCQRDGHRPPAPCGPEINCQQLSLATAAREGGEKKSRGHRSGSGTHKLVRSFGGDGETPNRSDGAGAEQGW